MHRPVQRFLQPGSDPTHPSHPRRRVPSDFDFNGSKSETIRRREHGRQARAFPGARGF